VAIVGITPSKETMRIAYQTAVNGLAAGRSAARIFDDIKGRAAFSGFRRQLVSWLDWLGLPDHLGLATSGELWESSGRRLLQSTSAVRYPVFVSGKNYSGTSPRLTAHPALRRYVFDFLAPELAKIPEALVIPLGRRVDDAIGALIADGRIDAARCLVGFPHPSGANGYKGPQWANNRSRLKRKVNVWFRAHPSI
jgi:hypothetical protein